jgi:hypothetical protein
LLPIYILYDGGHVSQALSLHGNQRPPLSSVNRDSASKKRSAA